jgi:hypothetical protein
LHVPEREEVWFIVRGDTTNGRILVFSYVRGKIRWSTIELRQPVEPYKLRDMVSAGGQVWLLVEQGAGPNGYALMRQSTTQYSDAGGRPPMTVRTRWFKPAGHLGDARFWRVHVFGTYGGVDKLQANVDIIDSSSLPADDLGGTDFRRGEFEWSKAKLALDDRLVHVRSRIRGQRGAGARAELVLVEESGAATDPGPVLHAVGWDFGARDTSATRGATFEQA